MRTWIALSALFLSACAKPPPRPQPLVMIHLPPGATVVATREARKTFTPGRPALIAYPRPRFHHYEFEAGAEILFIDTSGRVLEAGTLDSANQGRFTSSVEVPYALILPPGSAAAGQVNLGKALDGVPLEDLSKVELDSHTIFVEIARSWDERQHGLMYRPRMSENDGMLFVYDTPEPRSFWMGNTWIDLDIAFFRADGSLINVVEMKKYPDPATDTGQRAPSAEPALYVLELNMGWFRKRGLIDPEGRPARPLKLTLPPGDLK